MIIVGVFFIWIGLLATILGLRARHTPGAIVGGGFVGIGMALVLR